MKARREERDYTFMSCKWIKREGLNITVVVVFVGVKAHTYAIILTLLSTLEAIKVTSLTQEL